MAAMAKAVHTANPDLIPPIRSPLPAIHRRDGKRAQNNASNATKNNWGTRSGHHAGGQGVRNTASSRTIDGQLVAKSVVGADKSDYALDERVFHKNSAMAKSPQSMATN